MHTKIIDILLVALLCTGTGCSTIITGGRKDVNLRSNPSGAHVAISDEKGVTFYEGTTPTVVTLKTGKPYFVGKKYTVSITKEGFQPATTTLKSTLSGWYLGNFIFGGLVGLLIVDPLTGAMYTLPKEQSVDLVPSASATSSVNGPSLHVVQYSEVPAALRPRLVPIQQ